MKPTLVFARRQVLDRKAHELGDRRDITEVEIGDAPMRVPTRADRANTQHTRVGVSMHCTAPCV